MSSNEKRVARALQDRTGWSYSECLRCVRELTATEIEALVVERRAGDDDNRERQRRRG